MDVTREELRQIRDDLTEQMREGFSGVHGRLDAQNGRVRKVEVAIAVLKFAVFTIGGGLLIAGLQVVIAKVGG